MKKKKIDYYEEFIKMIEIIEKTTVRFQQLMCNYDKNELMTAVEEIHHLEHDADDIVHEVRQYLITDFLPPIDREDIGLLLHQLDDVVDGIDEITKNFEILNIQYSKQKSVSEYIDLLVEAAKKIKQVFQNLPNKKERPKLLENANELNQIENKADRIYETYIKNLFLEEKDPIEVIKWTTIYNNFESIFDCYEEIAHDIEDIIMKTL